jgi:hypothetical protein
MADAYKVLGQGYANSGSFSAVYTVPASKNAIIKSVTLANESGGAATVALAVNGTANSNVILAETTMNDGDTGSGNGNITLEATNTLQAKSDTASAVTVTVFGLELDV